MIQAEDKAAKGPSCWAFPLLWGAESISLLGTQLGLVALPLTAIQILQASALVMGLIGALGWLPVVTLGLFAGVWVDRTHQIRAMIITDSVRFLATALVPICYVFGILSIPLLLAVVLLVGICTVFFDISYQTYVVNTVPGEKLASANSRLELSRALAQLIGPAAAGALIAAWSAPYVVGLDAVSFGLGAIVLVFLLGVQRNRVLLRHELGSENRTPKSTMESLSEGIRFIRQSSILKAVIANGAVCNLFESGVISLQILFISRTLGIDARGLGVVLAFQGGAALLSAATTPRLTYLVGEGRLISLSLAMLAAGTALLAASVNIAPGVPRVGLVAISEVFIGLSGPWINVPLLTLRQRFTPPELLGRVNATGRVAIMSTLPLGSILFGGLGSALGLTRSLVIAAIGLTLVAGGGFATLRRAHSATKEVVDQLRTGPRSP